MTTATTTIRRPGEVTMRRLITLIAAAGVTFSAAPGARAQRAQPLPSAPPITAPLSLAEVVQRALRDDPDVHISEQAADAALGVAIQTHAIYDASLQSSVSHSRQNGLRLVPSTSGGAPAVASALTSSVTSSFTVQQRLAWGGIIVAPQVSVTGAGAPGVEAQSKSSASLGVTVPLSRDRFGALSRDQLAAAYVASDAAGHDVRQAAATGIYQATNAYWAYVTARDRLDVYVTAEERAKLNLAQTSELVAADERPASDLVQLRGNVANKTAARINAEQSVLEAWRSVAGLLGVGDQSIAAMPRPATALLEPPADSTILTTFTEAQTRALVNAALRARPDLAAVTTRVRQLSLTIQTTQQLQRPVINVVGQFGYGGIDQGWGVSQYVRPLYRNWSPLNATLQLVYQLTPSNSDAAGQERQAVAAFDQQRISQGSITREITTGAIVARDGLVRSIVAAGAADDATDGARKTVDNEHHKFRLGSSTVFDIIAAEDGLTNALLGQVGAQQTYANAVTRLQYETGALVTGEGRSLTPNIAGLVQVPAVLTKP
jgi:outer membrane protein